MSEKAVTAALCMVFLSAVSVAASVELYVVPGGADSNPGTKDKPFATLERARGILRELRKAGRLQEGATVWLRGGKHYRSQTFELTEDDSGAAGKQIAYRAYPGERPVLIGGRSVTRWQPYREGILKADLKTQGFPEFRFRQLFFNGKRQPMARRPNPVPDAPICGGWAFVPGERISIYNNSDHWYKDRFPFRPQDFPNKWAHPEDGEVFAWPRYTWWNSIVPIQSVDWDTSVLTAAKPMVHQMRPGNRFFVQGLFEELDAPGEWHLDYRTWTLYFLPSGPIDQGDVIVPLVKNVVQTNKTRHVTFRGIGVECAEGAAFDLGEPVGCAVVACDIRNLTSFVGVQGWGLAAIRANNGQDTRIAGNNIGYVGVGGIWAKGGHVKHWLGPPKTLAASNIAIDNNYVHHTGLYWSAPPIHVEGVGIRVSHNYVHDSIRGGITCGGWDHVMEYNHVRHISLAAPDNGCHQSSGLLKRGTVMRYNYIHDTVGFGQTRTGEWKSPYYCWGLYLDCRTSGWHVCGNVLARSVNGNIYIHGGRDNIIENNILIDGKGCQVTWSTDKQLSRETPKLDRHLKEICANPVYDKYRGLKELLPLDNQQRGEMTGNVFRRNIVCYSNPTALLHSPSKLLFYHNESDYNLIWRFQRPGLREQLLMAGAELSGNLAPNPGFEGSPAGQPPTDWEWWVQAGVAARALVTDKSSFTGKRSLRIDREESTGPPPAIVSAEIPVQPSQTYRIRAHMKSDKADAKARLSLVPMWWQYPPDVEVEREWREYEHVFRISMPGEPGYSPDHKSFIVRIELRDSGTLWVDDVSVQQVRPVAEWEVLKKRGFERHSIVADPLFVDAEHDDYRLKPGSPAEKIGFEPIPFDKIGLYEGDERASWPIKEAEGVRERPIRLELMPKPN